PPSAHAPTTPRRIHLRLEPSLIRSTVFSPVHRYSCLHTPSYTLPHWFPPRLHRLYDAPLPTPPTWSDTASAVCLSPAKLSAQNHLTSELLRTLSRVAASKPTSWLSQQLHILFHLAHA